MKILKTLLVLLLLLVVIGVIAMLVLPKNMEITRTTTIDAPASVTWKNVNSLRSMMDWSPWAELDTNQTVEYSGEDGAVGSGYTWSGNDKVGQGKQTITSTNEESMSVETYLEFFSPWESQADVSIQVEEAEEGTSKVSWSFSTESGMPGNLFMALMGAKQSLIDDFDRGLDSLKVLVERRADEEPEAAQYDVQVMTMDSSAYLIKRERISFADMKTYFDTNMPGYYGVAMQAGIADTTRPPAAMYFDWDEENNSSELSAAIPVIAGEAPEGFEIAYLPAGSHLVIDYYGSYDDMKAPHEALSAHMETNGLTYGGPVIEQYITDPGTEPDPSKWHTRIIYPVADDAASSEDTEE